MKPTPIWPHAPRHGPADPLPYVAFLPGRTPRPPEPRPLPPDEAFLRGIDLYHAGFLWEAHEQWESVWRASRDPAQRDFLQGLVQLAAAVLKIRLGNRRGAARLARRSREHLARIGAERCMGLAIAPLLAFLDGPLDAEPPRLEFRR